MKGKLSPTSEIKLESNEDQWRLLVNGIINNLQTSGIVEINPEHRVRVGLNINTIIPPEHSRTSVQSKIKTNLKQSVSSGIERITEFVSNKIEEKKWIFIGTINGANEIPIVIVYYKIINIFIYSQQLNTETRKEFFPSLN